MAFEKVDTQVDFPALEREVLALWQRQSTFERLRTQNAGKRKWSFLDGPITANNPMGVHHAWGRTYKDAYQRYFAMTGHELRYQNGFDCQGLWVEVEVEKELKLHSKRDIENLVPGDRFASIDKFVTECKERVNKFAKKQTEQSIRLGYWMDWDRAEDWQKPAGERRSYYTMAEENNYTIWSFLKKCHDRKFIYRGYDVMPWCGRCGVGLSEQEMKEGYQFVEHRACFVSLPLKDRPGENLLVWTTTPWTLTSNVGAAVNPELTYLKVQLKGQAYYVAKGAFKLNRMESTGGDEEGGTAKKGRREWLDGVPHLKSIEQLFKEKAGKEGFEVVEEVKGEQLLGLAYVGPFDELPAQQHVYGYPLEVARVVKDRAWAPERSAAASHQVVNGGADVTDTEGTGIVHTAPGCGQIDFQWGKQNGLPPVAPIGEDGCFLTGFGTLTGKSAADPTTAEAVFALLEQRGALFATERYVHRYPHCWRCKTELLYRLVDEWFISMAWRDEIMDVTRQVKFLPESINGQARELDWLKNMGDWMISKKRYWGLALPIWHCETCDHFDVIGGKEELQARAVKGWDQFAGHSPHRPWIDQVKVNCAKCGKVTSRIGDVGNPWLDAGIVPYSTMGYNRDRAQWEQWFPADFITECFPGQFRNWFYAILAMSTMMEQRKPFKVLLGHGLVRDQKGDEMHKSKGNAIPFDGAADTGYELFVERDPKAKLEEQAKRKLQDGGLPAGWLGLREGEMRIENKPVHALLGSYAPMGVDVMRWLYSRHNPAANINFGPGPADELRSKLLSKLWNSYKFFCDNARVPVERGGFDASAPAVPVRDRPDIDRWLLSDLQLLVRKAHEAFPSFNMMAFCLEAEKYVDDKLSNWWVRRNKRRFWKSEAAQDKLAAYQTLYTVLVTLTKLFAPVMPFVTESMYRNLVDGDEGRSVHLCEYPQVDESLIDAELSQDMDAVFDLVTLGSAARNSVKQKVRQPLAVMKVLPGDERMRHAPKRFAALIGDELNIKQIVLADANEGALLREEVKPNMKTLGPKFGPRLKEVQTAILRADPKELGAKVRGGAPFEFPCPEGAVMLDPADVIVTTIAPTDWAGAAERGTQVLIDCRITDELKREGMAREVIRHIQSARKDADLDMEDRIVLHLGTEAEELRRAIDAHRDYIGSETLTTEWASQPLGDGAYQASVKVDGQALRVELRKR